MTPFQVILASLGRHCASDAPSLRQRSFQKLPRDDDNGLGVA